ncbi:MAG: hypothetical protein ABSA02_30015 [Trebonia sp.]|jgi:hypothetical protein
MRITFRRFPGHTAAYSVIERDDGVVYRMKEFTSPGARLPHDLRHLVVERELAIADGLWGAIADGTVYTSMDHVQGRRPPHAAERSAGLKRVRRQPVMRAGLLADLVEAVAMLDAPSEEDIERLTGAKLSVLPVTEPGADPADAAVPPPAVLARAARALQVEAARWARLRVGEELVYSWPAAPAATTRALHAVPPPREAGDPRRTGKRGPR